MWEATSGMAGCGHKHSWSLEEELNHTPSGSSQRRFFREKDTCPRIFNEKCKFTMGRKMKKHVKPRTQCMRLVIASHLSKLGKGLCAHKCLLNECLRGRQNSGVAASEFQDRQWIQPGKQKVKKIIKTWGTCSPAHQSSQLFICSFMWPTCTQWTSELHH